MKKSETVFAADVRLQPESMAEALRFFEAQHYYEAIRQLAQTPHQRIVLTGM